jgi:hypothetical protein
MAWDSIRRFEVATITGQSPARIHMVRLLRMPEITI